MGQENLEKIRHKEKVPRKSKRFLNLDKYQKQKQKEESDWQNFCLKKDFLKVLLLSVHHFSSRLPRKLYATTEKVMTTVY
jgi:hypothetical protein